MAFQSLPDGTTVVTGPQDTKLVRLITLRSALGLEVKGMKRSKGRSIFSIVKAEFDLKGSKQKVYDAFSKIVDDKMNARRQEANQEAAEQDAPQA